MTTGKIFVNETEMFFAKRKPANLAASANQC